MRTNGQVSCPVYPNLLALFITISSTACGSWSNVSNIQTFPLHACVFETHLFSAVWYSCFYAMFTAVVAPKPNFPQIQRRNFQTSLGHIFSKSCTLSRLGFFEVKRGKQITDDAIYLKTPQWLILIFFRLVYWFRLWGVGREIWNLWEGEIYVLRDSIFLCNGIHGTRIYR